MRPRRLWSLGGLVLALLLGGPVTAALASAPAPSPVALRISGVAAGPSVPAGFVGLSTEYWDITKLVGSTPNTPDIPFEHLWEALAPGAEPSLRIGGDSSDWVWWPVPGMATPPWVHLSLTPEYAATVRKLAEDTDARLILGINLAADSPTIASYEVTHLLAHIPAARIQAFELGNEPDLYNVVPWYFAAGGAEVKARPASYGPAQISSDWEGIASGLGTVPLAGPAYSNFNDLSYLPGLLSTPPAPSLLTIHTYPLEAERCDGDHKLTQAALFDDDSLAGLAGKVAEWAHVATDYGAELRADEMNSVTCGGEAGFSDTFGPALWALNILPLYAETQVTGVNFAFETYTAQDLFASTQTATGWSVTVQPEYYGLLAFAQLVPPGSRILKVSAAPSDLLLWADRTPQHQTHVVVTNVSAHARTVEVAVSGIKPGTPATLTRLTAPARYGLWAASGVTLAGRSIDPDTGELTGTETSTTVTAAEGRYSVTLPAASAAILTL